MKYGSEYIAIYLYSGATYAKFSKLLKHMIARRVTSSYFGRILRSILRALFNFIRTIGDAIRIALNLNIEKLHVRIQAYVCKLNLQFLGTWYEVERTFYLPELASSCTALIFQEDSDRSSEAEKILSISINSINHWTGSPSQNAGSATLETPTSSIMDFQVGILQEKKTFFQFLIWLVVVPFSSTKCTITVATRCRALSSVIHGLRQFCYSMVLFVFRYIRIYRYAIELI